MDSNFQNLSALTNIVVVSRTTALPGSPTLGDIYIVVDSDPTNPDKIAVWDGEPASEAWVYLDPIEGWLAYVTDDEETVRFESTGWEPFGLPPAAAITTLDRKTANYTVVDGDLDGATVIEMNLAGANTLTVAPSLTGTEPVTIIQYGAGQTTITAGAGVTLRSAGGLLALRLQYSSCTIIPVGSDEFHVIGDLA